MSSKEVGTLRTRLSWEGDDSRKSLQGFKSDLKSLRTEMNVAKSGGQDYSKSLKGLKDQSDILSRQFKTQQEQVRELRKRYEESAKVKGEDARQTRNLSDDYNKAVAAMNRIEEQLKKVTTEINDQVNPWKKLGDAATTQGDRLKTAGENLSTFGRNYSLNVTAPIVAGAGFAFKAAMDFESAFAGVEKTVDGTASQMQGLRDGIREMAKEIPASTTEIAAVAEAAGQLGIETESIEEFTRTMIDLGEATNLSSEQAATEFARFANIVGMSQDDFDRLGSSVVSLGNNMATTEAEISSMAMRLAAQGKQVGMSEAEIVALAATMSSLGIESEAGGTAMTTVLKKIQDAVSEGKQGLDDFASAAGLSSEEFAKTWNENPVEALDAFIKGLSDSSAEGENLNGILENLGIKGIRESDTLLRMAGASDLLSEAVNNSTQAWEENSALTDEAAQRYATTESQLKILWNRAKDVAITLGEALIPAAMDALDAAEPLIQKIEEGAEAFADMDKEQQETILKMIALVAAVGPATVVLGSMATGLGSLLKIIGGVSTGLGKIGGAGLLGRVGLMGLTGGPVGLAIAGVAGLTLGVTALVDSNKDFLDINYEKLDAIQDEIDATDNLISEYEELESKNKLTTDEMLRYMDLLYEMKEAKSESALEALKEEQEKLLSASGLTNEEMERFLELNGDVIEMAPNTAQAISEEGFAYADNLDKLKELNAEKERELALNMSRELEDALAREVELMQEEIDLMAEIEEIDNKIMENRNLKVENLNAQREAESLIRDINAEILALEGDTTAEGRAKREVLQAQLSEQERILHGLEVEEEVLVSTRDRLQEKLNKKNEGLESTREEIRELDRLKGDYEELILSQVGLNSEKGEGLSVLNEEIFRLQYKKSELDKQLATGKLNTAEYNEQKAAIDEQIGKLQGAKGELELINQVAGETVYKTVNIQENPAGFWRTLDRNLSNPVTKLVNVDYNVRKSMGLSPVANAYAEGTDYHPGGRFLAGEEGFELGRMGNRWEMLNTGFYERPPGYQVFTHDESKQIIKALNSMPAYADGARMSGDASRLMSGIPSNGEPILIELHSTVMMPDGKVLAQASEPHITRMQNRNNSIRKSFKGGA
ncbi:hypothetical protein JMA_22140 [Jeotgalibacillus malaysiensis]|uniref:Phage tail tape measure protein domain-containing protein n=1 Tax=Jeotgalibacillus malaysiensis TaxID=1508404 RepID=A0A0B5AN13_9BACL|nr:phage tail tape measure protein [Jeotgalibacillus malaysiensis]AJD91531.1 hypothetical protein JMA_22140 [Jeotgalibacillus malaysiensis]